MDSSKSATTVRLGQDHSSPTKSSKSDSSKQHSKRKRNLHSKCSLEQEQRTPPSSGDAKEAGDGGRPKQPQSSKQLDPVTGIQEQGVDAVHFRPDRNSMEASRRGSVPLRANIPNILDEQQHAIGRPKRRLKPLAHKPAVRGDPSTTSAGTKTREPQDRDSSAPGRPARAWSGVIEGRRKNTQLMCCGRGNERQVARTIFNVLDMEGDNKVSWTEFCLFVKHSYEHFPALVQSFGDGREQMRDEVSRFRRVVLQAVMGDAIDKEELLVWEKLQDDVLEVLFEGSRKFEGKGFVSKARRVFRRFDANDSGAISFGEFYDALHSLSFFDFNVEVHGKKLLLEERSLCCCALRSRVRFAAIRAAYSPVFDGVLVAVIVLNTLVIAMEDLSDPQLVGNLPDSYSTINQFVFYSDFVFTALYFVEFLVKVVASGFCIGRGVYLSSWWNVFDFTILALSVLIPITFAFGDAVREQEVSEFVKVLRVFRILRPLKTITAVPNMRQLASTLVAAVRALKEVFLLLFLLWVIFATILVDLLHGRLNRRCHSATEAELLASLELADGRNASVLLNRSIDEASFERYPMNISASWPTTDLWRACGFDAQASHHCFHDDANRSAADELCLSVDDLRHVSPMLPDAALKTFIWKNDTFTYNEPMNYGITQFDNLGFALISLFQISTLEGWVDIMYLVQDGYFHLLAFWIFFIIMLICGVLMIGLVLAVISSVYKIESERHLDTKASNSWATPTATIFGIKGFTAVMQSMKAGSLSRWIGHIRKKIDRRSKRRALIRAATDVAGPGVEEAASALAGGETDHEPDDSDSGSEHDYDNVAPEEKNNAILPGGMQPMAVLRHKLSRLLQSKKRSPAMYTRCFRAVRVVRSRKLTGTVALLVALNVLFMCLGQFSVDEAATCQERSGGNMSAPCQEADREYLMCIANQLFVALISLETACRWIVLLSARCMSGTCRGTLWAQTEEERSMQASGFAVHSPAPTANRKIVPMGLVKSAHNRVLKTAVAQPVASSAELTRRRTLHSANIESEPASLKREVSATTINQRRCTGRCRADVRNDSADPAVEALFQKTHIRKSDYADTIVTLFAVIDVAVVGMCTRTPSFLDDNTLLVAVRAVSLLRVFRLLSHWKTTQSLFLIISQSSQELVSFFVLMLIFVYIYALLGLQLFANRFHFDDNGYYVEWEPMHFPNTCPPHAPWDAENPYTKSGSNFDTFGDAALTTFQIWSGEDWNKVMYFAIRSGGAAGPIYFVYFVFAIFAGNWLLLNLLVAIMLAHFELSKVVGSDGKQSQSSSTSSSRKHKKRKKGATPRRRVESDAGPRTLGQQISACVRSLRAAAKKHSQKRKASKARTSRAPRSRTGTVVSEATVPTSSLKKANDPMGLSRSVSTVLLTRKLSALAHGASHETLDAMVVGLDGKVTKRSEMGATHHSLGFGDDPDNPWTSPSGSPSVGVLAPSRKALGSSHNTTPPSTLKRKKRSKSSERVLGAQILEHMDLQRKWKKEASGALVVDDDVREQPHCCPNTRPRLLAILESQVYGFIRSSMAVLVTMAYCMFTPMKPNLGHGWMNTAICYFFVFTALFFAAEMILQQIALGWHYFRIGWSYVNMIATVLLLLGCFGIFLGETYGFQYLEVCRAGLTLYLYQVLAKLPVIRVTFAAIMKSVPEVFEVTLVVLFFMVMFSVVFIAEYKGKLGFCDLDSLNETSIATLEEQFGLTQGVIYYDFVRIGSTAARSPCNSSGNGAAVAESLPVDEQLRFSRQDCLDMGGSWLNPRPNFDNFPNSFMAMFHLATTEGWVDLMQRCTAAVGVDQHPMQGYAPLRAIAFVLYIFVVANILWKLAATVLVANFERATLRESGVGKLTATQQEWLGTMRALAMVDFRRRMKAPQQPWRRILYQIAVHRFFKVLTTLMVVIYMISGLAKAVAPTDNQVQLACCFVEAVCVGYFCLEFFTKVSAFGRGFFFRWEQSFGFEEVADDTGNGRRTRNCCQALLKRLRSPSRKRYLHTMNIVDLFSVFFCIAAICFDLSERLQIARGEREDGQADFLYSIAILFRALRLTRVISILRSARTIRHYLATLGHSLLAVGNIFILFFVLINTVALLMREFFHFVQLKPHSIGGLDTHGHFQSWVQAFGVMARSTTGEGWHKIAYDLMEDSEGCVDVFSITAETIEEYQANLTFEEAMHLSDKTTFGALATNGCHSPVAFPLFIVFIYLSVVCMMNVFLAVVLDAFGAQSKERKGVVASTTFTAFVEQWRLVDEDTDLFVAIPELMTILTRAPQPLGIGVANTSKHATTATATHYNDDSTRTQSAIASAAAGAADEESRRYISNALRTVYGNLNVSLHRGRVYFYDIITELLRVIAVQKARARGENKGVFFQSRAAVAKLNAMDPVLFRKLKNRWYLRLEYEHTLRQAMATVVLQKIIRGHLQRRKEQRRRQVKAARKAARLEAEDRRRKLELAALKKAREEARKARAKQKQAQKEADDSSPEVPATEAAAGSADTPGDPRQPTRTGDLTKTADSQLNSSPSATDASTLETPQPTVVNTTVNIAHLWTESESASF